PVEAPRTDELRPGRRNRRLLGADPCPWRRKDRHAATDQDLLPIGSAAGTANLPVPEELPDDRGRGQHDREVRRLELRRDRAVQDGADRLLGTIAGAYVRAGRDYLLDVREGESREDRHRLAQPQ